MQTYTAPLRDMRFVMHELHDSADLAKLPGLQEVTPDLLNAILEEAAKFIGATLLPLNAGGDAEGCHYEDGVVRTPNGFKAAYQAFVEGGWGSLNADPAYGGQGLPESVSKLVEEMICGCNLAFGLYPGLSHGAYLALKSHGSKELKDLYLPKMVDGSWSGTMCLTEAHCGTDLGLLRTKALPQQDGSYRVSGSKIFISAGEHDLTKNIIHLVLARLPDAAPGVKGISLFLVPKFLPNADGSVGARNGVRCVGIEHKMGIKGSATCQLNFDQATGWLVGEPHKGMQAMFVMMNSERLSVGTQGLGVGELAYQSAAAYAKERLQGRALGGAKHPEKSADPNRASRRAPYADDHASLQRGLPGARVLGRECARSHGPGQGPRRTHGSRGFRRAADAGGEGAVYRSGLGDDQSRFADLRWPRLRRRSWHGAVGA
jgi:alkylation response protein AidB-like acyl-CoA dehydrogenase